MTDGGDKERFLTARQIEAYGRFAGIPAVEDLERSVFLDDVDRKLVRVRRGAANRLRFALKLTVFGLLKLLGVAYRPERVDLTRIRHHWPNILRLVASVNSGAVSACDVKRMLQHGGNPTQLGHAPAHLGRIFKTVHVLAYVDAESYRRAIKRMRNLQEGHHSLAKHVFHGRPGELREPYHAGIEDQLGAFGLGINRITLWNTVYLDVILDQLRADGFPVLAADVARLSPYLHAHINVHGHYTFQPPAAGRRNPDRDDVP